MESNMISFEKWINSNEDYVEQENNIEIMQETLKKVKDVNKTTEDIDYKHLVETHSNFSEFIHETKFDDYIDNFTFKSTIKSTQVNEDSVFRLAKAVTNPNVIDLIAKNYLNSK
jgi:hypothetical protein